jgi:hypothetical protein
MQLPVYSSNYTHLRQPHSLALLLCTLGNGRQPVRGGHVRHHAARRVPQPLRLCSDGISAVNDGWGRWLDAGRASAAAATDGLQVSRWDGGHQHDG